MFIREYVCAMCVFRDQQMDLLDPLELSLHLVVCCLT